jgi:hypothetical protein
MRALLGDDSKIVAYFFYDEQADDMITVCLACATKEESRDFITAQDIEFNDADKNAVESWEESHPEDHAVLDRCSRCKKAISYLTFPKR